MTLKIGQIILYKNIRKEFGEIKFEDSYSCEYPSLLILEEDIIWKHSFSVWGIEDWGENVKRTILFAIVSLLLKKNIEIKVFEKEHILLNRPIVKYLYFSLVGKRVGKNRDLLENSIMEFIETKADQVSGHSFLRKLLRHITIDVGPTQIPDRDFVKSLVKKSADINDFIKVVKNSKSFNIQDDFEVVVNEKYKAKLSSDYKMLSKIIVEQCSENDFFRQFCEELDLCVENIMNEKLPDSS